MATSLPVGTTTQLPVPRAGSLPAVPPRPAVGRFVLAGVLVIALFFGGFGAWAGLAPLASAALATGIIRAESNRKTMQHLEGGIIAELLVREGDHVIAGQTLIRLDTTAAQSRHQALRHQRDLLEATRSRVMTAQKHADAVVFLPDLENRRQEPRVSALLANQEQIFATRRRSYEGQRDILLKQMDQLRSQIAGMEAQIIATDRQTTLIAKEQRTVAGLVKKGLEREPRLLDLQRRAAALEGSRAESQSGIARAEQSIGEAQLKILALDNDGSEKLAAELEKVQADLARVEEELMAAADVLRRRDLQAPISGTIMNMKFFTPGGVITPGTPVLDIVPSDDRLLIEAQISPLDIDIVRAGLPAEVRFSAYKARRTPVLDGIVTQVSADRFLDERQGFPYYKALVEVDLQELADLEEPVELYPGMPAEVMIKTGERSFFDYLIQPVVDSFGRAFHEQ